MKENKTVKTISKGDVENLINSINEATEKRVDAESSIDFNKVKEVIIGLEGCTVSTVMSLLTSSMLLLPASAIISVLGMGRLALETRIKDIITTEKNSESSTSSDETSKE